MERKSIKVKRKPVTEFSKRGMYIGQWFAFPKPNEDPPRIKTRGNQRILWCPYCNEWEVFVKQVDRWVCTGVCGFSNTNDFYVKSFNGLWFEDVPTSALKNMSVPAPGKRRK